MRLCPKCRTEFVDSSLAACPFDDWGLVTTTDFFEADGDPLLGATLGGRFRIEGRLGIGAMGTVYRAVQASVERPVALKVLRPDLTKDPETAARFHREAHATSSLKHPNTVTLYDFGQTDEGQLFIAMELLEGRLLGTMLKEDGELQPDLAVRIVVQVARSLAEAHRKGIVHRDLKPDNIMLAQVEGQEVVKVLDFGIAKIVRGDRRIDALETQAGTVFGTPRYMSPEQAQSKVLDARSDIYTLGVIFFHMLTGHAPFEDSDAVVVMARHIKTKPQKPSDVRPDLKIPRPLERIAMRMLAKDRNKRPQSAEQLIELLGRWHPSASDDDFSVSVRSRPTSSSRYAVVGVFVISLLLAAGAVLAYAALTRGPPGQPALVGIDEGLPSGPAAGGAQDSVLATTGNPALGAVPGSPGSSLEWSQPTEPPIEAPPAGPPVDVTVDSEPSGATILRDGVSIGTAPQTVAEVVGARVTYSFVLADHETTTETVVVREGMGPVVVGLTETGSDEPDDEPERSRSSRDGERQPHRGRHGSRRDQPPPETVPHEDQQDQGSRPRLPFRVWD